MLKNQSQLLTNMHRMLDMSWVIVAFITAYYIKRNLLPDLLGGLSTTPNYYLVLMSALSVCFLVFNAFSIYESRRTTRLLFILKKNVQVVFVSQLLLVFFLYMLHVPSISRLFFLIFGFLLFILLSVSKIVIYKSLRYYRSREYNTRNVLVVGTGSMAQDVIKAIIKNPESGYKIIGCLETSESDSQIGKFVYQEAKITGAIIDFQSQFYENVIDELIFAISSLHEIENITDIIGFAEELGINVQIVPDFQLSGIMFKPQTARVQLKQFVGLPVISISSTPENESAMIIKSFIDYIVAGAGVLIMSPLFLFVSILIKITSSGPVFFLQERCGLFGRWFDVIKFRTMVDNADELKGELEDKNEAIGPVFKIKNDPRITPVGKILRKTSLDELPQLINVLMGHMSLVGPRPPLPEEVEKYKPWQRRKLSMKPGLTCIWQVSGRNAVDFERWMRMDLQYIDTWSLWLDFKILLLTLRTLLSCNGK